MKPTVESMIRTLVFSILVAAFAMTASSFFMGCAVKGWQIKQCTDFCYYRGGIDYMMASDNGCTCNNGEWTIVRDPEIIDPESVPKEPLPESESE